jgi:hypothetical protein
VLLDESEHRIGHGIAVEDCSASLLSGPGVVGQG